ncbi:MAG: SAM-dependent methyltransferase, partial [Halobacteria archaeon]|nr:SAM-dependent methyltransferase [Halobacteria archaeon]
MSMNVSNGQVYIVGAGPGEPDLMTVKAHRLIQNADVVLHDSLVSDEIVDDIPESSRVVNVGKKPGGERTPQ